MQARLDYLVHHPLQRSPRFSAILGLKFRVRPEHFEEERMHLRCTVTLPHVLNTSSAEAVIKNRQRTTSGLMAPSEDGGCALYLCAFYGHDKSKSVCIKTVTCTIFFTDICVSIDTHIRK
ncbi:hypothetical protein HPB48_007809 [Haemaphysalis longicornis]|uniref:Uncharacterized protein n=1 Tax=Haemaphysalis longicornis TaxID=44386 RepID=A0A9J6FZA2_HAELO|nr:hypothetical protein HPB48_007809 [Haemaphysalis longicornis]